MALSGAAIAGLLLGGGAVATVATVAIVKANQAAGGDSAGSAASGPAPGGLFEASGGLDGFGLGSLEPSPLAAASLDAFGQTASTVVPDVPPVNVRLGLSERAERRLLRDSRKQVNSARLDNAVNTALVGGLAVSAVRKGLANPALQRAVRLSPVASRVAAGATLAAPAAAGAGVGVLAVKGLDKTGALDAVAKVGQRAGDAARSQGAVGRAAVTVAKSVALPVSTVGAVVHGVATKATVAGNVKQAYSGTVVAKGVAGARKALRKVF